MAEDLIYVEGEEFIGKIICGERDFKSIRLQEGFDFEKSERVEGLRMYLDQFQAGIGSGKRNDRLDLSSSELHNIRIVGLQFNYMDARDTSFMGSNLQDADMRDCWFDGASFENTILNNVGFYDSDMTCANLRNASVSYSRFENVDLTGADLRGIQRLDEALGLEKAIFLNTKVTKKEKAIIDQILSKTDRFKVLD